MLFSLRLRFWKARQPSNSLRRSPPRLGVERLESRTVPATFTVGNTLEAGPGSLRQAILDANSSPGADLIRFEIPASDAGFVDVDSALPGGEGAPDAFVIRLTSELPGLNDPSGGTVIDGRSQAAFGGDANPFGPEITLDGQDGLPNGLTLSSDNNQVLGLNIQRFGVLGVAIVGSGGNNTLAGNYIGTDATGTAARANGGFGVVIRTAGNTVGGTAAGARNIISGNQWGVFLNGTSSTGNQILGNYIGTDATGTRALGNSRDGVLIDGGRDNTVGGADAGAGNLISGNGGDGVWIRASATGNLVLGNFIGTDVTGTAALGNDLDGVWIDDAPGNTVGGADAGARNVISGNGRHAVVIEGSSAAGNQVLGNYLGTDVTGTAALGNGNIHGGRLDSSGVRIADAPGTTVGGTSAGARNIISGNGHGVFISGTNATGNQVLGNSIGTDTAGAAALGNSRNGILISTGASGNTIGGTASLEGNLIAFNTLAGVAVVDALATGNSIRGNSIHDNGGLGIDLGAAGVTPNDSGDADSGANQLQNYPVITSGQAGAPTRVAGVLNSTANTTFTLDFYANPTADPSGHGEGRRYLGSATVTTDAGGNAAFDVTLTAATVEGEYLAATATNPAGNTSEFSRGVAAVNQAPTAHAGGPYSVGEGGSVQLDATGSSDPNQPAGTLTYTWDLDGDGVFGETGASACRGDETGARPTFSPNGLDGPATVAVTVRANDAGGLTSTDSATISIANSAPTASVTGPTSGVTGQPLSFTLRADDPATADDAAGFTFSIDWGDGSPPQTIAAGAGNCGGVLSTHAYAAAGTYTVVVTATDKDGVASAAVSRTITITTIAMQPDPCHPGETALVIGGTAGDDHIQVVPVGSSGAVRVSLNSETLGEFTPTGRILVYAQAGDDDVQVAGAISHPAWLDGGTGDDRLKGGAGDDVLLAGDGDDLLSGGGGRDLLVGGRGADRIVGNNDDDILIAGMTAYDNDDVALCLIMHEWTRTGTNAGYAARVSRLRGEVAGGENGPVVLNDGTVFDDGAADVLTGSAGMDWFLLNQDGDGGQRDRVTDLGDAEFANDLDFILGA